METNPRPQRSTFLRAAVTRLSFLAVCVACLACLGNGEAFIVRQPEHPPIEGPDDTLTAGVFEEDITPPAGLPIYGYSSGGNTSADGYWMRLKARIIALSRGKKRLVMVQLDLGATSSLVQRELGRRLADVGLGPENLLVASTHTHGGPGGFFGEKFFNGFVAAAPGFDPKLVDHFVSRIEHGIRKALAEPRRARVKIAQVEVDPRASHNRSRPAWERNFADLGTHPPPRDVDPTLTLIRVDTSKEDGAPFVPAAAWTIFGVHGTSVPSEYPLYHGDVHGYAARLVANAVQRRYGVDGFVAATSNGAEGDVSPGAKGEARNRDLTRHVAGFIADGAIRAMTSLDCDERAPPAGRDCTAENARAAAMSFDLAYAERSIRGANTSQGRLCQLPFLGAPVLAGSEEGRGPVQGAFGIAEGAVRTPGGCDSTKVKGAKTFLGPMLHDLLLHQGDFPDVLPFQVVTFGAAPSAPDLVLGMWPGEPTTEIALRARRELGRAFGEREKELAPPPPTPPRTAIIAHANGYGLYFTTGSEFVAQHYEGGNSIYGPHQGQFVVEQLALLARSIRATPVVSYRSRRVFYPGEETSMIPGADADRCDPRGWGPIAVVEDTRTVTFHFTGAALDERCELPAIRIDCRGKTLVDAEGFAQTDQGLFFEVRHLDGTIWSATWTKRARPADRCVFVVSPAQGPNVTSEPFTVQ